MIRIAAGSGFWGDWPEAPALQVRSGPIDYLVLDYLAEVTTAILDRIERRDPGAGYARDFVDDLGELLPEIVERGIRVIASAGGVNPRACAEALLARAGEVGAPGLRVGVVDGSDVLDTLRERRTSGDIRPFDADAPPFEDVVDRLTSAHAYLGADPIVRALDLGARVVVTGRCTDASLTLAAIAHELGLAPDDWNARALGTVVGHVLECGAQASGGNFLGDWRSVPELDRVGYPIAEISRADRAVVTKHPSLGGRVSLATVKEQLVYEIGDPRAYTTADCVADFTTIRLTDEGGDRVGIQGVRGRPAPDALKVTCVYPAGWKVVGEIVYAWPEAEAKARAAADIVRRRAEARLGPVFDEWSVEVVGAGALFGRLEGARAVGEPRGDGLRDDGRHVDGERSVGEGNPASFRPDEVVLRISARAADRTACDRLGREIVGLILAGPPGATGYAAGRPRATEVGAVWSCLVPRSWIRPHVEVLA